MIVSPIPYGSGAFIVHSMLEKHLKNYKVVPCSPKRSYFPPSFYPLGRNLPATIVHAVPESAIFHYRTDRPLIVTVHGYAIDKELYSYSSLLQNIHGRTDLRWLYKQAMHKANVITTVSNYTADLIQNDLKIKKPVDVIYNGVDETIFKPKKRNVNKEIKVLFSGNLSRRKGAHLLLPIIKRLDKNIVIYYTSGLREKSELVAHPRLKPLGRVPYDDMPKLYQNMDILLLPTVREGHSIAVLEAMACGLPVIASNVASLPEQIIHKQGGFLCPLDDIDTFATCIQNLADNFLLRQNMGDFNRNQIEKKFTLDTMLFNYKRIFEKLF